MAEPKSKFIGLRITRPMYEVVKRMADEDGVSRGEYTRRLWLNDAERRGLWPPKAKKGEVYDESDSVF